MNVMHLDYTCPMDVKPIRITICLSKLARLFQALNLNIWLSRWVRVVWKTNLNLLGSISIKQRRYHEWGIVKNFQEEDKKKTRLIFPLLHTNLKQNWQKYARTGCPAASVPLSLWDRDSPFLNIAPKWNDVYAPDNMVYLQHPEITCSFKWCDECGFKFVKRRNVGNSYQECKYVT